MGSAVRHQAGFCPLGAPVSLPGCQPAQWRGSWPRPNARRYPAGAPDDSALRRRAWRGLERYRRLSCGPRHRRESRCRRAPLRLWPRCAAATPADLAVLSDRRRSPGRNRSAGGYGCRQSRVEASCLRHQWWSCLLQSSDGNAQDHRRWRPSVRPARPSAVAVGLASSAVRMVALVTTRSALWSFDVAREQWMFGQHQLTLASGATVGLVDRRLSSSVAAGDSALLAVAKGSIQTGEV